MKLSFAFRTFLPAPALLVIAWAGMHLPYPDLQRFLSSPYSIEVQDRNGVPLQVLPLRDGLRREFAAIDDMPPAVVRTFRRSEDGRFYLHPGVDPVSLARAFFQYVVSGRIVSGASTISMQLARLVSPDSSARAEGVSGKFREMLNALRIEAHLSKRRILELWLNSIPFGSNAVGVESAAKTYFGKDLRALTPAETLLLAVIPRRPELYAPADHPHTAAVAAYALGQRLGLAVTETELERAARNSGPAAHEFQWPFETPHFIAEIAPRISNAHKASGLPMRTTINIEVQHALEASLRSRVAGAAENRISNGAGMVVDNRTGEILAWVGSTDFFDTRESGQVDGVLVRRQPGSTLKPYLYARALEMGYTPASILPDIPSQFGKKEVYIPENFNRRFNGPVRLRTALASSLNVPAVYTLQRIGVANFVSELLDLGFVSLKDQQDSVGVGLALGNAEVTLYELVRAFSTFPRGGRTLSYRWKLEGSSPDILTGAVPADSGKQFFPPWVAGTIRDILSDRVGRVTGFGTRSILDTPFQAMFKTGTSNQFNNIWAVGATVRYTVGIWMGNFSGDTVIGRPGSSLPAAVGVEMLSLLSDAHDQFPPVPGVHPVQICSLSGGAATPNCTSTVTEYFQDGVDPEPCTWHRDPSGTVSYPPEYQTWARNRRLAVAAGVPADSGSKGGLELVHPHDQSVFYYDPSVRDDEQELRVEAISPGASPISLFLNGGFIAEGRSPLVALVPVRRGTYVLEATQADAVTRTTYVVR